ncbi:hypothetical protein OPV22_021763 [Ensete ventricosum]|uniref:Uncharacterized protein n=1 Tax=Ensete ventricosum TaxID=4639 RepID=A0AAV8PDD6_ENSVE|nr:hypothetical protein OPV22_021763 [Ensete ventricosum]
MTLRCQALVENPWVGALQRGYKHTNNGRPSSLIDCNLREAFAEDRACINFAIHENERVLNLPVFKPEKPTTRSILILWYVLTVTQACSYVGCRFLGKVIAVF